MGRHHSICALFLFLALLCAALPLSADYATLPITELVGESELLVMGTIARVSDHTKERYATFDFEIRRSIPETPGTIRVRVSSFTARQMSLEKGRPLILMLVPGEYGAWKPYQGIQGMIRVDDGSAKRLWELVSRVHERGGRLNLVDVEEFLRAEDAVADSRLLDMLLEQLAETEEQLDPARLKRIACELDTGYSEAVEDWAMMMAGELRTPDTLPCLVSNFSKLPRPRQIVVAKALGDYGDPAGLEVLREFLVSAGQSEGGGAAERASAHSASAQKKAQTPAQEKLRAASADKVPPALRRPPHSAADQALLRSAIHAAGKIGDPSIVPALRPFAEHSHDMILLSGIVTTLGRVGGAEAEEVLKEILKRHPTDVLGDQVQRELDRIAQPPPVSEDQPDRKAAVPPGTA